MHSVWRNGNPDRRREDVRLAHRLARLAAGAGPGAGGAKPPRQGLRPRTGTDRNQDHPHHRRHDLDRPLAEAGGKGLFTKEIEEALRRAPSISPYIRRRTCRRSCRLASARGVSAARGPARRVRQPRGQEPARAAPRRGGRHLIAAAAGAGASACGRISLSCRCAATSRRGCARSTLARPTPPCWRSPD